MTWVVSFSISGPFARPRCSTQVVYGDNEDEAWFSDAKPSLDALRAEILADALLRPIEGAGDDVDDWNCVTSQVPGRHLAERSLVSC